MGPVTLSWIDLVGALALCAISLVALSVFSWQTGRFFPLAEFFAILLAGLAFGLCIASLGILRLTRRVFEALLIVFGFGLVALACPRVWLMLALLAGMVVVSQWGLWAGLAQFPWDNCGKQVPQSPDYLLRRIGPCLDDGQASHRRRWRTCLIWAVVAWAFFVVGSLFLRTSPTTYDVQKTFIFPAFAGLLAAFRRYIMYMASGRGPMSWWARIRTGNLSFPKWDIVHLGPFLAVTSSVLVPQVLYALGLFPPAAMAIGMLVGPVIAVWCPPSFTRWHLTGAWSTSLKPPQPIETRTGTATTRGR